MRHLVRALLVLAAATVTAAGTAGAAPAKPRLRPFKNCAQLIAYGNRYAHRYAPATTGSPPVLRPVQLPVTSEPAAGPQAGSGVSGTNVQEPGVDEPDTVKTDGRTIFAVSGGVLRAVDVSGPQAHLAASLPVGGFDDTMLLAGDRLLVFQATAARPLPAGAARVPLVAPGFARARTRLTLVDVADPARPRVLRTLDVDGSLLAARMTGGTVRVVIAALPRAYAAGAPGRRHAAAWLPSGTFRNARTDRRDRRSLIACRKLRRPPAFSGLQALAVLTIDPAKGLEPVDSDGVLSGGDEVYASEGSLFVATRRYDRDLITSARGPVPEGVGTEIHRFELSDPDAATYRGSARVPGFLLNQFSMSEADGVLRVASTDEPPWFADRRQPSQSRVTTFSLADGAPKRLGQVAGLGHGERIYAVRFLGDVGYVVTFRQTDPLYTVDLSDPAAPRVRGELRLLGYSAYLHPIGDGRLLGIGQDASEDGRTLGTQLSLFDVSDPAAPRLLQRATLGDGSASSVEWDHHAFLWWPATRLAVLPVTGPAFMGALGFTIADGAITEAGRISLDEGEPSAREITRSLLVGDRLYTLSAAGLGVARLDTLSPAGFVPFG